MHGGYVMDKQTAASLLDNLVGMVEDTQENDYDTALKMGIEALKAYTQLEIKTKQQEYVYIVFGDDVRSDGENIYGIHRLKKAAKDDMDCWKEIRPDMIFHIEKHALDD
jgi:hypothetical protein